MAAVAIGKPFPEPTQKLSSMKSMQKSLVGIYNFDDGSVREITLEDGQFYSQRTGSSELKIFQQDKRLLTFESGLTSLHFVVKRGKVISNRFQEQNC